MSELYLPIKHTHLLLMAISVGFFIVRAISSITAAQWITAKWAKISPHVIDTLLVSTGIGLAIITSQYPFLTAWLTVKIGFLIAYIGFGVAVMKAPSAGKKLLFFALAMLSVVFLISVALSRNPMGFMS